MFQSEQIQDLAKSLAAAQAELNPASKNAENPHLRNRYADIAAVWDAIREILPKHGLSVAQTIVPMDDGRACVRTVLLHTSGQWLSGECALPVPKQDPQGFGSAITYARRYSLSAMIGVVSEDDDDGEAAKRKEGSQQGQPPRQGQGANRSQQSGNTNTGRQSSQVPPRQTPPPALTKDRQEAVIAYLTKAHGKDRAACLLDLTTVLGREVKSTSELTNAEADKFMQIVNAQGGNHAQ